MSHPTGQTTTSPYPYELEDVVEILIEGYTDFFPIIQGSLVLTIDEIGDTPKGFVCVDKVDNLHVYFFAHRLLAVKFKLPGEPGSSGMPLP